jgi:exonuclease III
MTNFRVTSWNTAKRLRRIDSQVEFLRQHDADIVALQEVIPSTEIEFRRRLKKEYPHIISSFELAPDTSILIKKRMFGQLILSKFPLQPLNPKNINVPWQERVLSCVVNIDRKKIALHTTHIPPGSSNGGIKIQMINGIVEHLISHDETHEQILCGDFNTPKFESKETGLVTFGQNVNKQGKVITKKSFRGGLGYDWDLAERSLFEELPKNGFLETFRIHNPNDYISFSWQFSRKGKQFTDRFDHLFASKTLCCLDCNYLETSSEMSDHLPITAMFQK